MEARTNINLDITAIAIIVIILIVIIIASLVFWGKKLLKNLQKETSDVDKKNINYKNLSYDPVTYDQLVWTIRNAIEGWGTDEEAIYSTLEQLQNIDDLYYLIKRYKTLTGKELFYDLNSDLDSSEMRKVNQIINRIKKGI